MTGRRSSGAPASQPPDPTAAAPRFHPRYAVVAMEEEGLLLLSERGCVFLPGSLHACLGGLLDGSRTADQVVDALPEVDPARTYHALLSLEVAGHLVRTEGALPAATELPPFPDMAPPHPEAPGEPEIELVSVEDELDPVLLARNRKALAEGRAWMSVRSCGEILQVGPLLRPGGAPCWACVRHRLRLRRPVEAYLEDRGVAVRVPRCRVPGGERVARALAAREVAGWQAAGRPSHRDDPECPGDAVVTLDLRGGGAVRHPVVARPQCSACGDPSLYRRRLGVPPPPGPDDGLPAWSDGGYRSRPPEAFLEDQERRLVSPVTGIAPALRRVDVPGAPRLRAYAAGANPAWGAEPRPDALRALGRGLRNQSAGKGRSDVQARASALGEAVERYCGTFQGDEVVVRASLADLDARGRRAMHPNRCMLFSARQYAEGGTGGGGAPIPAPFDREAETDWTPAWSLTRGEAVLLPTAFLYWGHADGGPGGTCRADSNGCASGTTGDDALLQGLLELVERDAVAMWWYNRVARPAAALPEGVQDYAAELEADCAAVDRELWLLDLTHDLGIPVYAALTRSTVGPEAVLPGLGAHPDPAVAALRALTEAAQMIAALSTIPDPARMDREARVWLQDATVAGHAWLAPRGSAAPREPVAMGGGVKGALRHCRQALEDRGLEVLVLDQTRPDVGVPVMKAIVPGLRHFWPRFAPGRLQEVPVALSWLEAPVPEEALNPVAFFL